MPNTQHTAVARPQLSAVHLRNSTYAVRPAGQLGTCGWVPVPWEVIYVHAHTANQAVLRATIQDRRV